MFCFHTEMQPFFMITCWQIQSSRRCHHEMRHYFDTSPPGRPPLIRQYQQGTRTLDLHWKCSIILCFHICRLTWNAAFFYDYIMTASIHSSVSPWNAALFWCFIADYFINYLPIWQDTHITWNATLWQHSVMLVHVKCGLFYDYIMTASVYSSVPPWNAALFWCFIAESCASVLAIQ